MTIERMSPLDASFLHLEGDSTPMSIASVAIFEGPAPAYDEIYRLYASKLQRVPRFRQVVRFTPMHVGRPAWVDDPTFQLAYHLRHTALPAPGSDAELRMFVGRQMAQRLDRGKPLWEAWVVEGLSGNRWAIFSKVHHCMVDGVSGTELLTLVMEPTPDPFESVADDWNAREPPTDLQLTLDAAADLVRNPYEQLRAVRSALRRPRELVERGRTILGGVGSLRGSLQSGPDTSLKGAIGPHRRYAWASTTVDDMRRARKRYGGTFNDVVLAAITGGFRHLLLSRGETPVAPLRTLVPVSVRARDASGVAIGDGTFNNQVSGMLAHLPVEIPEVADQLRVISAELDGLKDSKQAVAADALVRMTGFAPPMLLALGARQAARFAGPIDTITSNVPGPQTPLYCVGRRMVATYPYVMLNEGVRVGVAIFSYLGDVTFAVTADYDSVPDIDVLVSGVEQSMAALTADA